MWFFCLIANLQIKKKKTKTHTKIPPPTPIKLTLLFSLLFDEILYLKYLL